MKRKLFLLFSLFAIVAIAFTSCQKDSEIIDQKDEIAVEKTTSGPDSDGGVTPVIISGENSGGNRTCDEVGTAFGVTFDLSIGQLNYEDGAFDGEWPAELNVVVTNGKYVSFNLDKPVKIGDACYIVGAVIVKGGAAANVYFYADGAMADQGLAAPPVGANQDPAGLSNLTFCFFEVECEEEECWKGETAWGGNTAGGGPAWWFYYDTNGAVEQAIYAGQKLVEDAYAKVVDGVMTIVLGDNMRLDSEASEPVKVQGYNTIPNRRPAAGQFKTYKGDELEFEVAEFDFYAIHLDVEVKVDCPEGEE